MPSTLPPKTRFARRRATLELIGSNGYTSDYPIARIYRDAQVLTVWEGPANIQALELLRLLTPKYAGDVQYERRIRGIIDRLPSAMSSLRSALDSRLQDDLAAIAFVTADQASSQRYARKLLERLSHSLAFAFMCEAAAHAYSNGDNRRMLTATRYYEETRRTESWHRERASAPRGSGTVFRTRLILLDSSGGGKSH